MSTLLKVTNLSKRFGETQVFENISFEVPAGSVTVIIGSSGSGKTTILRSLNGLEKPESGTVEISSANVDYSSRLSAKTLAALRSQSGMVFQGNNLFGNLTALGNITIGPVKGHGVNRLEADQLGLELLEQVGLAGKENSYPHELSGGQQQRVGIARALALKPKVLLFDEPTSALDPELVGEVLSVMKRLAKTGWTMVVVTHEMSFAREIADQVLFIDKGQIVESGNAESVLKNPQQNRTKEFLQRIIGDYEI